MKLKYKLLTLLMIVCNFSIATKGLSQNSNVLPKDKQNFIDSLIITKMQEYNVPGLTVGLVLDSTKIFYKGYGFSDIEHKKTVEGDVTGFKIASITKTFTAFAIMQLYEEGKIDLHKDIKHYLPDDKFEFINGSPITIDQLLTHTAGFDITDINDAAKTQNDLEPLFQTINNYMPERVHLPGEVHSYSNFGYALLGYIIEQVSGLEYDEYLQKNIFEPLDMNYSSVTQPLPKILEDSLSKSYYGNTNELHQRDYTKVAPADGIISTAKDMTNYMLALLNTGNFEGNQLLGEEAFSFLTSQQYGSFHTRRGICYSFFEGSKVGLRSLEHTGGAKGFASILILIPESGTGLFISQNKRKGTQNLRYELAQAILAAHVSVKEKELQTLPAPISNFESKANKYEGYYRQLNYNHSTFEKITQLFGMNDEEFKVDYHGNNLLSINDLTFIPLSDTHFIFDHPEHNWEIEFKINKYGDVNKIFNNTTTYSKIKWFERNAIKRFIGGLSLIIVLLNFLITTISKIKNSIKHNDKPFTLDYLYLMSFLILFSVLFFVTLFAIYKDQLTDYGIPFLLRVSLFISTLVAIISMYSLLYFLKILKSNTNMLSKIWVISVITSVTIIVVYFWHYNLLGFQF